MWNFARTIQKKVILASLLGMKNGFFFRIPSAKKGRPWRIIHIDRKTESLWQEDDALFGGTRRVWSIMSYWSLAKRLIPNTINNNWSIWTVRCLKNDQNTKKRQHKVIFLHDNAPSHTAKPVRNTKHSAGKFYPMRLTHQTWLLLITTCLHRWVTHLLSSALVRTKMWKNGSMNGSRQKGKIFTGVVSTNCPKDGKNV